MGAKVTIISDGALHLAIRAWNLFTLTNAPEFNRQTTRFLKMAKERVEWYTAQRPEVKERKRAT